MIANLSPHGGHQSGGALEGKLIEAAFSDGRSQETTPCELNFLKRKRVDENSNSPNMQQQQQQQQQQLLPEQQRGCGSLGGPPRPGVDGFKKRHLEAAALPTARSSLQCLNNSNNNNNNNSTVGDFAASQQFSVIEHRDSASPATASEFSLIGSAGFMSDLFAYDSSLMVPLGSSLVAACTSTDQHGLVDVPVVAAAGVGVVAASNAAYPPATAVSGPCVSLAPFCDAASDWQETGDLLELDHRYNSGLHADISHLNATVHLKGGLTTPSNGQQLAVVAPGEFLVPPPLQKTNFSLPVAGKSMANQQAKGRQQAVIGSSAGGGGECDFEDKNLSWLLNFRFDELPHLSPDVGGIPSGGGGNVIPPTTALLGSANTTNVSSAHATQKPSTCSPNQAIPIRDPKQDNSPTADHSRSPKNGSNNNSNSASNKATGKKFEELVMEVTATEMDASEITVAEHIIVEGHPAVKAPKKPPFTYTELIEYALEDKGELTVSGIYQWISDRFPYYKSNDDRWKNSVRHNLSINPHFRKGSKAPQGAGHLWTISSGDSAENILAWEHKKQRLDLFFKMESLNRERMQQHLLQQAQHQQQHHQAAATHICSPNRGVCGGGGPPTNEQFAETTSCSALYDEAAAAVATISREMLQHGEEEGNTQLSDSIDGHRLGASELLIPDQSVELPFNDLMTDEELRKTAGQILNGIHRDVEVQSVHSMISTYHDVLLDNDYLNPIHKDVPVHEVVHNNSSSSSLGAPRHMNISPSCSNQTPYDHHQHHHHHNNNSSGSGGGGHGSGGVSASQYYVTEIDPLELGIQMAHRMNNAVDDAVLFHDDFNLNYFVGYNSAGNDIAA